MYQKQSLADKYDIGSNVSSVGPEGREEMPGGELAHCPNDALSALKWRSVSS